MVLMFKDETYRGDFTFANSPAAIRHFPFPFHEDKYMYAVNIEPHTPGRQDTAYEFPIDIDEHYLADMRDRAITLAEDPLRCQSLPHMLTAEWDLLELLMTSLARDCPRLFAQNARTGDHPQMGPPHASRLENTPARDRGLQRSFPLPTDDNRLAGALR
jgi:hypothetical protein